jgi:hypothetical protein
LKVQDSVIFEQSTIEEYPQREFDVVIANGVLYHVDCLTHTLQKLASHTRSLLIFETRVVKEEHFKKSLKKQIEANDLPYKLNNDELVGFSGHKYETAISDGSSHKNTIVTLPTASLLLMHLKTNGFNRFEVLLNEREFRNRLRRKERPLDGVIIAAWKEQSEKFNDVVLSERVESAYMTKRLNDKSLFLLEEKNLIRNPLYKVISILMRPNYYQSALVESILNHLIFRGEKNKFILKDLKYAPNEKLLFEKAKKFFFDAQPTLSENYLLEILKIPNCDWRTYYRSLYLLFLLYSGDGREELATNMKFLLKRCNPKHFSLIQEL